MMKLRNRKGFTLIELMIVVAIIGILAAIAIPNFLRFQAKSKQSEAKELLSTVYTAEQAYFAEQNEYAALGAAGFTPSSTPKYYSNIQSQFTFTNAVTGSTFTGTCSANIDGDATLDAWEVHQNAREPSNTTNDVTG